MATFNQIHRLELSWSTSKGRDTYGYNIARLDDSISGKRYKTCGGGYDMVGTVLGEWFQDQYQAELLNIQCRADTITTEKFPYMKQTGENKLYGMHWDAKREKVTIDGGCGVESMLRIIEACGFEVERSYNKKGHVTTFYVSKSAQ